MGNTRKRPGKIGLLPHPVESLIHVIRRRRVMLDADAQGQFGERASKGAAEASRILCAVSSGDIGQAALATVAFLGLSAT